MAEKTRIKDYIIDTCCLIDNPNAIDILRNGKDGSDINRIFIPLTVIEELDGLKKDAKLRPIAMKAIDKLNENRDNIIVIKNGHEVQSNDNQILKEMEQNKHKFDNPVFVTNDRLFQFKAKQMGFEVEDFKASIPFESESEEYTGFVNINEGDPFVHNCFYWKDGRMFFNGPNGEKPIDYENKAWKVMPKNVYQNAAMELLLNDDIPLVTIQSAAGHGKSFLSLACALEKILVERKYEKLYVFKTPVEQGKELGFLPGNVEDKMEPYTKHIKMLLDKLHGMRKGNTDVFLAPERYNPNVIEILPINYIRGMNLENCIVLVEETQNIARLEMRTLLTRMCENVKCVCIGDVKQVDNPHLNTQNNGLNWTVKMMKGQKEFGHVVLKGAKSRGPITDMVLRTGL